MNADFFNDEVLEYMRLAFGLALLLVLHWLQYLWFFESFCTPTPSREAAIKRLKNMARALAITSLTNIGLYFGGGSRLATIFAADPCASLSTATVASSLFLYHSYSVLAGVVITLEGGMAALTISVCLDILTKKTPYRAAKHSHEKDMP